MKLTKINKSDQNENHHSDYYILGETSFIHEGDIDYLTKLIEEAKKGKCDGIKFQILLDKDNAYAPNLPSHKTLDNYMFNQEVWLNVIKYARKIGLEVLILPIDLEAVKFCKRNLDVINYLEIHSICFNDYFILKEIESMTEVPIVLGVGGRTFDEINYAMNFLKANENIILMYGFQSFPTNIRDVKLNNIKKYKELYNVMLGYADHTQYNDDYGLSLIEYAYILGARIFEKHITLKEGEIRTDYEAAVEYKYLLQLRNKMDKLIVSLGKNDIFTLNEAEIRYKSREKQLVYTEDLKKGNKIRFNSLGYKITPEKSDYEQRDIEKIVGCILLKDVNKNNLVKYGDIENKQS